MERNDSGEVRHGGTGSQVFGKTKKSGGEGPHIHGADTRILERPTESGLWVQGGGKVISRRARELRSGVSSRGEEASDRFYGRCRGGVEDVVVVGVRDLY